MNHCEKIIAAAREWIGTPYRHQASVKGVGCDCLGLVRGVWRETVGPEPEPLRPYSPSWAESSDQESLLDLASRHFLPCATGVWQGGDLLIFRFREDVCAKHVAIAASHDAIIHAHDGACVVETPLIPYWRRKIVGAFSFPDPAAQHEPSE